MEKETLEAYVNQGLSSYKISKITGKGNTTIVYWLRKYGLKTKYAKGFNKICQNCDRPTEQGRRLCHLCQIRLLRLRQRIALVKYKGGKCIKCGLAILVVLDFHHRNSEEKDFTISKVKRGWKALKKEVDKCDLMCANCHRVEHSDNKLYDLAMDYNGYNTELEELLAM